MTLISKKLTSDVQPFGTKRHYAVYSPRHDDHLLDFFSHTEDQEARDLHHPPHHIFRGRRGFTLIELLVASVIVSVALLGVFSLMRQASQVESRAQEVWRSRGQADAIADHLANALKHSVVVSTSSEGENESSESPRNDSGGGSGAGGGGILAGVDDSGGYRLRVFVLGSVYDHGTDEPVGGTRWLEYRWYREALLDDEVRGGSSRGVPGNDRAQENQAAGFKVELRSVLLAGNTLLSSQDDRSRSDSLEEINWDRIEPVTLATGLDEIELSFRAMPDGQWQSEFEGAPADALIRLRIRVGNETIERIFYPRSMPDPAAQDAGRGPSAGDDSGGANP